MPNVLVFGPQHAGKSSFINMLVKYFDENCQVPICLTGRTLNVGTLFYDKVQLPNSNLVLFDPAGKPFEECAADEVDLLQKLLDGVATDTPLLEKSAWKNQAICPENRIDRAIFVLPAKDFNKNGLKKFNRMRQVVQSHLGPGMKLLVILTRTADVSIPADELENQVPLIFVAASFENHTDMTKALSDENKSKIRNLLKLLK